MATDRTCRKTAKPRRLEVAGQVDELLAEIIETMGKWGVGTYAAYADGFHEFV